MLLNEAEFKPVHSIRRRTGLVQKHSHVNIGTLVHVPESSRRYMVALGDDLDAPDTACPIRFHLSSPCVMQAQFTCMLTFALFG